MVMTINYRNAFKEVYVILNCLEEEEFKKIPKRVFKTLEANMNHDYEYEVEAGVHLKDQKMLPETRVTLYNIFRDYLSTPEQKKNIIEEQNENRRLIEKEKAEKYNPNKIFETNSNRAAECNNEEELIEVEESFLNKIISKIKNFISRLTGK